MAPCESCSCWRSRRCTNIDIEPPESNGTATFSVDDRGDTATITIEGETSEGVSVDATVECHSVFDFRS